jgi:hypothetical protein
MIPTLAMLVALSGGCIELQQALEGVIRNATGGRPPSNGGNGGDDGSDGADNGSIPVVRLIVSNPNPRVSDGLSEEVILTCEMIGGDADAVTFEFQGPVGRLLVDPGAGSASLIVDESDVGQELIVTCTATNAAGTSELSNEQVIIPTS